jgi:hypothetical protein
LNFIPSKHKQIIHFLKIALAVFTISFIVYKLLVAYQIDKKLLKFDFDFSAQKLVYLVLAVLLMAVNLGFEVVKWHLLINQFEKINYKNSLKAILSGISLSIITPNQIGDFAGRVIHLKILDKIKGSLITIIGNTAQVMTTAIFGMFGLLAFVASIDYNVYQYWKPIALFFLIVQLVAIFFFLRIRLVSSFLNKISFLKKFEKHIAVFKAYSQSQLFKVLVFSFLRYVVFSLQYVLLLYFFNVQIGLINCYIGVIVVFCIQSVVPSFILLDIGLRGASALFVFNELSNFDKSIELGVLLSAYTLWIINLLIPSLFGLYIILKHKFTLE